MNVQVRTLPIEDTDQFFELFKMAEENTALHSETKIISKNAKTYGDQAF